jgi:hypothetical protein
MAQWIRTKLHWLLSYLKISNVPTDSNMPDNQNSQLPPSRLTQPDTESSIIDGVVIQNI